MTIINKRVQRLFADGISKSPMLKNAGIVLFLRLSGAFLLFVFNWLVIRLLGVEDSGVFFLAFTILNIFSIFALYGVDQLTLRKIPATKSLQSAESFFNRGFLFVLISSVMCGVLLYFGANIIAELFRSESLSNVLKIFSLTVPLMSLTTYLGMAVRARKKYKESAFILTNSYYITSILLFSLILIRGGATLSQLSLSFLLSMLFGFAINLIISSRTYSLNTILSKDSKEREHKLKNLFQESHHLFITSVIILGFGSLNIIMVGFFLSDYDVSIFSIAEKIAKLLTFSLFAINIVLSPIVSKLYSENNIKKLNIEVQKATLLSACFALPIYIIFILFPSFILGLFGSEYSEGANILRILSSGQLINALTGAVLITMIMTGLEKKINIISISTLFFEVIIGAILIPKFDLVGAAFTAAVGYSTLNIVLSVSLKRHTSINIYPGINLIKKVLINVKNSIS